MLTLWRMTQKFLASHAATSSTPTTVQAAGPVGIYFIKRCTGNFRRTTLGGSFTMQPKEWTSRTPRTEPLSSCQPSRMSPRRW